MQEEPGAEAHGCTEHFSFALHPNRSAACINLMLQAGPISRVLSRQAFDGVPVHQSTDDGRAQAAETAAALTRCARGDRLALRVLFDNEAGRMLGIAYRILRRRDLAEEVVQEAFVRIWRNADRYDPELGSARSWLYAIVRNLALNVVRDGRREILIDDSSVDPDRHSPNMPDVLDQLSDSSALRRCLERLDGNRRASLLLAYVGGFSHGEIAGRLRVPLGTVKAWIRRGLLALRECLA